MVIKTIFTWWWYLSTCCCCNTHRAQKLLWPKSKRPRAKAPLWKHCILLIHFASQLWISYQSVINGQIQAPLCRCPESINIAKETCHKFPLISLAVKSPTAQLMCNSSYIQKDLKLYLNFVYPYFTVRIVLAIKIFWNLSVSYQKMHKREFQKKCTEKFLAEI